MTLRWRQALYQFLRWLGFSLGTLALLAIAFVVWFYAWLVPHLDDWRPLITAYASRALGCRVEIDALSAPKVTLVPSLHAKGVRLFDDNNQVGLSLDDIQVHLSPHRLLLGFWDSAEIEGLQLHIRQTPSGQWRVGGFLIQPTGPQDRRWLDWLLQQPKLNLKGSTLVFTDADVMKPAVNLAPLNLAPLRGTWKNIDLSLTHFLGAHTLSLSTDTPMQGVGHLHLEASGQSGAFNTTPSRWSLWSEVQARLQVEHLEPQRLPVAQWAKAVSSSPISPSADPSPKPSWWPWWEGLSQLGEITQLKISADNIQWQDEGFKAITIHAQANAQALQADLQATWQRGLGYALQVDIPKLHAKTLQRVLPTDLHAHSPHLHRFLTQALQGGVAQDLHIEAKGLGLNNVSDPARPHLHVQAQVREVMLDLASLHDATPRKKEKGMSTAKEEPSPIQQAWQQLPPLQHARAEVTFDTLTQPQLKFSQMEAQLDRLMLKGEVQVTDLDARVPVLGIKAETDVDSAQLAHLLESPAMQSLLQRHLDVTGSEGQAHAEAALQWPLDSGPSTQRPTRATWDVQARFDHLQMGLGLGKKNASKDLLDEVALVLPTLSQLSGSVHLTQEGLMALNLKAQLLGEQVQLQKTKNNAFLVTGRINEEGIQAWAKIAKDPWLTQVLQSLHGTTDYSLSLDLQTLSASLTSNLQGLALNFPEPLRKTAAQALPLNLHYSPRGLSVTLGAQSKDNAPALIEYTQSKVEGSQLTLNIPHFDSAAWTTWMQGLKSPAPVTAHTTTPNTAASSGFTVRALIGNLNLHGRHFKDLVLGASRSGTLWRINANSDSISGYFEYEGPSPQYAQGLFKGRLAKLSIPDNPSKAEFESLLGGKNAAHPDKLSLSNLPVIDMRVDDFEFIGRRFGTLELLAKPERTTTHLAQNAQANTQQELRIEKLNLLSDDFQLKSTGVWSTPEAAHPDVRRMDMQFHLEAPDAGALLTRLGTPQTLSGGPTQLDGRVAWMGSPLGLDYPSLIGKIKLDVGKGRFLKIKTGATGRLLNVLSLQALPKLITLDFKEVFTEGFAFDFISGEAQIQQGIMHSDNLRMKGPLALVEINGQTDLAKETQDLHVHVLPDVNVGGASVLTGLVNPLLGVASFLTQLVLQHPVLNATMREYRITGSWKEPVVTDVAKSRKSRP